MRILHSLSYEAFHDFHISQKFKHKLELREGDGVRNPAQQLSAASHQAAAASKQKALPVLQANQDPFGSLVWYILIVCLCFVGVPHQIVPTVSSVRSVGCIHIFSWSEHIKG